MITLTTIITFFSFLQPLLNGLFLKIAWEAVAPHFGLPTFSYWVYFAVMWTVCAVFHALRPKQEIKQDKNN